MHGTAIDVLVQADTALAGGRPDLTAQATELVTANTDDVAAMTLALRAAALRTLGRNDEALAAATEAVRYPSRLAVARHRARLERARIYLDAGMPAKARADADKVLAEAPADPAARAVLEAASLM